MNTFYKSVLLSFLGITVLACVPKAGNNQREEVHQKSSQALATCPSSATAGHTITCSLPKDFDFDCQCFFSLDREGESLASCRPTNEGLEIAMPPQPGTGDLIYRCGGDGPYTIAHGIRSELPDTSGTNGASNVSGSVPSEGGAECLDNSDCVVGRVCRQGSCVVATPSTGGDTQTAIAPAPQAEQQESSPAATATPPPAVTVGPLSVSLSQSQDLRGTKLGMIRLKYEIQNAGTNGAKYLFFPADEPLQCNDALFVTEVGQPFNNGSPALDALHNQIGPITKCMEERGMRNCQDSPAIADADPSRPLPITCRVELKGTSGTLYTFLRPPARYVLAAQAEDGEWTTTAYTPAIPSPELTSTNVAIDEHSPVFHLQAQYKAAPASIVVTGCAAAGPSSLTAQGDGTLTATCPFKNGSTIAFTLTGIDPSDRKEETYAVHCEDSAPTLRLGGKVYAPGAQEAGGVASCPGTSGNKWFENCNAEVDLEFYAGATRTCVVSKVTPEQTLAETSRATVPWDLKLQVVTYQTDGTTVCGQPAEVAAPDAPVRLQRDHKCHKYETVAYDADQPDRKIRSSVLNFPYKPQLTILQPNTPTISGSQGAANMLWGNDSSAGNPAWLNAFCQYDWPQDECDQGWGRGSTCSEYDESHVGGAVYDSCSNLGAFHARTLEWKAQAGNCKNVRTECSSHRRVDVNDPAASYQGVEVKIQADQKSTGETCNLVCEPWDRDLYSDVKISYGYSPCQPSQCVVNYSTDWSGKTYRDPPLSSSGCPSGIASNANGSCYPLN